MAAVDPRLKSLKIKTGVLKRLTKEKSMYEKEVIDQEGRIEKMKADGKDEYDIKKQTEVLQESVAMIPDCTKRIKQAYEDLSNCLLESESDLNETEEYQAAKELLSLSTVA